MELINTESFVDDMIYKLLHSVALGLGPQASYRAIDEDLVVSKRFNFSDDNNPFMKMLNSLAIEFDRVHSTV